MIDFAIIYGISAQARRIAFRPGSRKLSHIMFPALRLAFRYMRTKRRGLVRLTYFMSVAGIAVGVAGLMVAQSVGRGFEDEMRVKILSSTAHITVRREDGFDLSNHILLKEKLTSEEGVVDVRSTSFAYALMTSESGSDSENVVVRVDETDTTKPGTVILGERLAEKFAKASTGKVAITQPGGSVALDLERLGTFTTGIFEYDSTQARISKKDFAKLQGASEFVPSTLSVTVRDIYESPRIRESIKNQLGPEYRVLDWQESNRPLFSALALERRGALAVIGLILVVAALNVTTTLSLLVTERRLDIAVLRTCGATGATIVRMFVIEGILIATAGTVLGLTLGAAACTAVNRFGLLRLPSEVYSVSEIHLRPSIPEALAIASGALLVSLVAALVPAIRSASIKPVENLRRS